MIDAPNQDPDTVDPRFEIFRGGKLGDGLKSTLGSLLSPSSVGFRVPTLQGLLREIGDLLGIDPGTIAIQLTGSGPTMVLEITLPMDPGAYAFEIDGGFDLGASVPGLVIEGSGTAIFTVDPSFQFTFGLRLGDGLAAAERFYLVEDAAPEATLAISAQLDNPNLVATLGFLGLTVSEDLRAEQPGNRAHRPTDRQRDRPGQ